MGRKRRKPWLTILAVLLLAAGLGVLLYPTAKNVVYDGATAKLKKEFLQNNGDNFDELYALLKAENKRMFESGQERLHDALPGEHDNDDQPYAQPAVDLAKYGLPDNIIGFISLPSIKIELPIILGANSVNMMKGAVHLTETSYPIGGPNTNSVIAAHRGQTVRQFREIHRLQAGDEVIIRNFRETITYRVVSHTIIHPWETDVLTIRPGEELLTLFSCHPLGNDTPRTQRYVVFCERV